MNDSPPDFTREPMGRFEWERILRRIQVSVPSVKLVGFAMATYANADGTRIRPGQKRLAAVLGASEMTIRRGQAELEGLGMLEMVFKGHSQGRGQAGGYASEYRLTIPSDLLERVPMLDPDEAKYRTPMNSDYEKDRTPTSGEYPEIPDTSEEIPDMGEKTPDIHEETPDTHVPPPHHSHHNKDHNIDHQSLPVAQADAHEAKQGEIDMHLPAENRPPSKADLAKQLAEDFNDWYAIYPKHVGRGAAVNAYTKARKNGATGEQLTAGASRYAAERKGQDPQFTALPATWLNQERWTDESPTKLSPWDPAFHNPVPAQYQWCNTRPTASQVRLQAGYELMQRAQAKQERQTQELEVEGSTEERSA